MDSNTINYLWRSNSQYDIENDNAYMDKEDFMSALSEYEIQRVGEEKKEIERLTQLLKEARKDASDSYYFDGMDWSEYCEANNITQP